eukprot:CFRG6263T1
MSYGSYNPNQAPPPNPNDPLYQWFLSVDSDRSGSIDQDELQRCLTMSGISGSWKPFSSETCRLMIAMLDKDQNGTLCFDEFRNLWGIVNGWKQVFVAADQDRSGFVDERELLQCISQLGYRLSPQTIHSMALRYSDNSSGQIGFDDFVACIVRMRALTDGFMVLDYQRTGVVQMPYDKFLQLAMTF